MRPDGSNRKVSTRVRLASGNCRRLHRQFLEGLFLLVEFEEEAILSRGINVPLEVQHQHSRDHLRGFELLPFRGAVCYDAQVRAGSGRQRELKEVCVGECEPVDDPRPPIDGQRLNTLPPNGRAKVSYVAGFFDAQGLLVLPLGSVLEEMTRRRAADINVARI